MLDDRDQIPIPALEPFIGWSWDQNFSAVLGDKLGTHSMSPMLAASTIVDFVKFRRLSAPAKGLFHSRRPYQTP